MVMSLLLNQYPPLLPHVPAQLTVRKKQQLLCFFQFGHFICSVPRLWRSNPCCQSTRCSSGPPQPRAWILFSHTGSRFSQIVLTLPWALPAVLTRRILSDKSANDEKQIHTCIGGDFTGRSTTHYRRNGALPQNCWSNVKTIMTQDSRLSRPWRRWFIILLISIQNLIMLCNFPTTQRQCFCSLLPQG